MEAERIAALVHQLQIGGDSEYRTSRTRSWQLAAGDFQALSRAGQAEGRHEVVFHHAFGCRERRLDEGLVLGSDLSANASSIRSSISTR